MAISTSTPHLLRLLSTVIPERWRLQVVRDLREEASRRGRGSANLWIAVQILAIGTQLRRRAVVDALPARDGVFTGFHRDVIAVFRQLRRARASTAIAIGTLSVAVAAVVTVAA